METKIVIYDSCKGSGKHEHSERVDYHKNICDFWDEPCRVCNGTGRMVKEIKLRRLTKDELELKGRH